MKFWTCANLLLGLLLLILIVAGLAVEVWLPLIVKPDWATPVGTAA